MTFDQVINSVLSTLPNMSALILMVMVLLREMRIKDARIQQLETQMKERNDKIVEIISPKIQGFSSGLD